MRLVSSQFCRRPGGIALMALIALPVVLLALVVALTAREYGDIRVRMQNEVDAAALAGAQALVGDTQLRGYWENGANATELFALLANSRNEIRNYAQYNPVFGGYSTPDWNLVSPSQGDIVFGSYDRTQTVRFVPLNLQSGSGQPSPNLNLVNGVRVLARRGQSTGNPIPLPRMPLIGTGQLDAVVQSLAALDRDVVGFRPLFNDAPIPLVPIAIDLATWQQQINAPFTDQFQLDPATVQFVAGSDALPEITITLTPPKGASPTGVLLDIGLTQFQDFTTQIANGVLPSQLGAAPFNGAFVLQPVPATTNLLLAVPGQAHYPATKANEIVEALNLLAQAPVAPRIWPLFNDFDGNQNANIVGFVAARIVAIKTVSDGDDGSTAIQVTLQPTMISVPSAQTDSTLRGYFGVPSPYLCKVRLVPQ